MGEKLRGLLAKIGRQKAGDAAYEIFSFPDLGRARYRPLRLIGFGDDILGPA